MEYNYQKQELNLFLGFSFYHKSFLLSYMGIVKTLP